VQETAFGTKVDLVHEGCLEDLNADPTWLREEKGRAEYFEYMFEALAVLGTKGLWASKDVTMLDQFKKVLRATEK
jgi:hypothetical protein